MQRHHAQREFLKRCLLIGALGCLTATRAAAFESPRVVVVGIDGLGGEFLPLVETPHLDALAARGAFTYSMQNALETSSSTNWMSMIAGAGPDQHGVYSNSWDPGDSYPTPTIFQVLRQQQPTSTIGVFHDWRDFGRLVEPGVANRITHPGDEEDTLEATIDFIQRYQPDLTFMHLDHVDHAGHGKGWGSLAYYRAIQEADALVGRLVAALADSDLLDETVIVVSADHGGDGRGHGADRQVLRSIPFIIAGPGVTPGYLDRTVRIWDIAPTISHVLGLERPEVWVGEPIFEAFGIYPRTLPQNLDWQLTDAYDWQYDSRGTGARENVSIWRPRAPAGYATLGDVAVAGDRAPAFATVVVRDRGDGTLVEPLGFERIWHDRGSGGTFDVTLWQPIPPFGYTCLGGVAESRYDQPPSGTSVRCVANQWVRQGYPQLVWLDAGSGARWDVSLWASVDWLEVAHAQGPSAHTFMARRDHSGPGFPIYALLDVR